MTYVIVEYVCAAQELQKAGKKSDTEAELARLAKSEEALRDELTRYCAQG